MLKLENVRAGYGEIEVLKGINLYVDENEVVALIGSNGAGKTTLANAICGMLPLSSGAIFYKNCRIDILKTNEIVEKGVVQVPERRELFDKLTVKENLLAGALTSRAKRNRENNLEYILGLFPKLNERLNQIAGTLSGGEQQMLTIARALMAEPELLILDEPSQGLAPSIVKGLFKAIREIHDRGVTVLIIEQNVYETLKMADRAYIIENGEIIAEDSSKELLLSDLVRKAYLGV